MTDRAIKILGLVSCAFCFGWGIFWVWPLHGWLEAIPYLAVPVVVASGFLFIPAFASEEQRRGRKCDLLRGDPGRKCWNKPRHTVRDASISGRITTLYICDEHLADGKAHGIKEDAIEPTAEEKLGLAAVRHAVELGMLARAAVGGSLDDELGKLACWVMAVHWSCRGCGVKLVDQHGDNATVHPALTGLDCLVVADHMLACPFFRDKAASRS